MRLTGSFESRESVKSADFDTISKKGKMVMSAELEHKKAQVNESGQLPIPAEYRDELGLDKMLY